MKLTCFLYLVFFPAIFWAQPDIQFDSTTYRFGVMNFASDGRFHFRFKNTGNEPLVVFDAKGSCGCIVSTWPKEPILPGKSNEILIRYDTKRIGSMTKSVTVHTNCAENSMVVLTLKGRIRPLNVLDPDKSFIDYGYVQKGEMINDKISFTSSYNTPVAFPMLNYSGPIRFEHSGEAILKPGEAMTVPLTLDTRNLPNQVDTTLIVPSIDTLSESAKIRVKLAIFESALRFKEEKSTVLTQNDTLVYSFDFAFRNTAKNPVKIGKVSIVKKTYESDNQVPEIIAVVPDEPVGPNKTGHIHLIIRQKDYYRYRTYFSRYVAIQTIEQGKNGDANGRHILTCEVKSQ